MPPSYPVKDPLDKVLPQMGIIEPPILLHRKQRQTLHQDTRIQTHPDLGTTGRAIQAHALHAATGGLGTEDITTQVRQLTTHLLGIGLQGNGHILSAIPRLDVNAIGALHQTDRRSRHAQTNRHLGTNRYERKILSQLALAKFSPFMAPIKTDWLPQQAGANPDNN